MDILLEQIAGLIGLELLLWFFILWKIIYPIGLQIFTRSSAHLSRLNKWLTVWKFHISIETATLLRDGIFVPFRHKLDPILFQESPLSPEIYTTLKNLHTYLENNQHIAYHVPELFLLQLKGLILSKPQKQPMSIYSGKPLKKSFTKFESELYRDFSYTYFSLNNQVKFTLGTALSGFALNRYKNHLSLMRYPLTATISEILLSFLLPLVLAGIVALSLFVVIWQATSNLLF